MRELLLGTAIIVYLFSPAYASDTEAIGDVARGIAAGEICNFTINTDVAAKYLDDELEHRQITALVLANYIKAAATSVENLNIVIKDEPINCDRVLGAYGAQGAFVHGLLEPKP